MLWNSKPLPGLSVAISENMILKVPFYEVTVGPRSQNINRLQTQLYKSKVFWFVLIFVFYCWSCFCLVNRDLYIYLGKYLSLHKYGALIVTIPHWKVCAIGV